MILLFNICSITLNKGNGGLLGVSNALNIGTDFRWIPGRATKAMHGQQKIPGSTLRLTHRHEVKNGCVCGKKDAEAGSQEGRRRRRRVEGMLGGPDWLASWCRGHTGCQDESQDVPWDESRHAAARLPTPGRSRQKEG